MLVNACNASMPKMLVNACTASMPSQQGCPALGMPASPGTAESTQSNRPLLYWETGPLCLPTAALHQLRVEQPHK